MKETSFSIQINGQEFAAHSDQTILEVAQANESYIPSICFHPNLGTIQTCDTLFCQC